MKSAAGADSMMASNYQICSSHMATCGAGAVTGVRLGMAGDWPGNRSQRSFDGGISDGLSFGRQKLPGAVRDLFGQGIAPGVLVGFSVPDTGHAGRRVFHRHAGRECQIFGTGFDPRLLGAVLAGPGRGRASPARYWPLGLVATAADRSPFVAPAGVLVGPAERGMKPH